MPGIKEGIRSGLFLEVIRAPAWTSSGAKRGTRHFGWKRALNALAVRSGDRLPV
jgi:hypothetical protein